MIAHGVSRGLKRERDPAPEGRKIPGRVGSVAPLGLGPITHVHPRLTPWATVFRPSGPGATSRGTRGDVGMDAGAVRPFFAAFAASREAIRVRMDQARS